MKTLFRKCLCFFVLANLCILSLPAHQKKDHECKKCVFTVESFAGKYDMLYSNGGGSRSFNGVLIIDKQGNVTIPVLEGFVFSGVITAFSYPTPQTGTFTLIDPILGIAMLSFPNPVDLILTNSSKIFATIKGNKVTGFTGSFVGADTFIQQLKVIRICETSH